MVEHPLLVRYHDAVDRAVEDVDWAPNADFSGLDIEPVVEAMQDVLEVVDDLGPMTDASARTLAEHLVPVALREPSLAPKPVMDARNATELIDAAMTGLRLLRGDRLDVANHLDRLADHSSTQDVADDLRVVAAVLRSSSRWDRSVRLPHHRHDGARLVRCVLDLLQRP